MSIKLTDRIRKHFLLLSSQISISDVEFLKCAGLASKGQLERKYKLPSYEKALTMLKNDMCITEIGRAVLKTFHFKVDISKKSRLCLNVNKKWRTVEFMTSLVIFYDKVTNPSYL